MTKQAKWVFDSPATHQPTKVEMGDVIAVSSTPNEIAAAVPLGGTLRRKIKKIN